MFPEMKTTLNGLSFCQISLYSLAELTLGTVETLHMKDYFLFGLVTVLSCLFALFFPETSLFTALFARVIKFVVLMRFPPNLLKKSIKHCSLFATARE